MNLHLKNNTKKHHRSKSSRGLLFFRGLGYKQLEGACSRLRLVTTVTDVKNRFVTIPPNDPESLNNVLWRLAYHTGTHGGGDDVTPPRSAYRGHSSVVLLNLFKTTLRSGLHVLYSTLYVYVCVNRAVRPCYSSRYMLLSRVALILPKRNK